MIIESFITFMNKIMLFSSYVDNTSSFPQTLTADDERKYFAKYKAGDQNAKAVLVSHNLRLVAHIVKKYSNSQKDADDLISVGAIGLIKAIETYSLDKGTQLSTYAARCIENEILMLFRTTKKQQNIVSLDEKLGTEKDGNEVVLGDVLSENVDLIDEIDTGIITEDLLKLIKKTLNPREYEILVLRYGIGGRVAYTQREVAQKLGISRSYISRIEKRALQKIRKKLGSTQIEC